MTKQTSLPILTALFDAGEPQTAKALEVSPVYMGRLREQGLINERDLVRTGRRGRPAIVWGLTDKGRKRVRRAKGLTR